MENITEPWTFTFPAEKTAEFQHIIDKANRRLARAGADARFEPVITVESRTETTVTGASVTVEWATATMDSFRLSLGQYTFVARLVPEEAGMTVHTAPGESLEGWARPDADDMHCDHCGVNRYRTNLFVVRDEETGEFIQLGQQCIQLFTGLNPKGLWALNFDDEIRSASEGWGGGSRSDYPVLIDQVIGTALALTDGGRSYVSKARADEWGRESTGSDVRRCIYGVGIPTESEARKHPAVAAERERLLTAISEGLTLSKDEALMAEVKSSAATLKSGTDYADNMAIILAAESGFVSYRNIGTLASLVAVHHRRQEDRAKAAAKPEVATGYIGDLGERVRDFTITATVVRVLESYYGTTTLVVGTTEDGHTVKWFASGFRNWEPGDRIHFGAATVKAHEEYQGIDQTVLTRGHKVEVLA